ncbi:MAG: tyrosine-type recombinase/integrase [Thermoplasmata archaeon]
MTREMVEAYAQDRELAPTTRAMNLGLLRQFLADAGAPLALRKKVWKAPKRVASRRRWLTEEQFVAVLNAARGRQRIVVALAGMMGLRCSEIRSARIEDVRMEAENPSMIVRGKGDKLRVLPMDRIVWAELLPVVTGAPATQRVYPWQRTTLYHDVMNACRAAGVPIVSPHDLRRSYGRFMLTTGVDLMTLRNLYGHASVATTQIYVGVDEAAMRQAAIRMSDHFTARLRVPGV